jgi:uncharacterized cupredoxin-like copper-binding protein
VKCRFVLGLFLIVFSVALAACGSDSASSGAQEVQVTLSEYKIASSVTTFAPGTPYHFVVTINGKVAHEFMIMPMGMNMQGMSMDDMHKVALHMIDNVAPGETQTFDYTFASSLRGQTFEFACHLPGHYEAGMRLPMMVSQ